MKEALDILKLGASKKDYPLYANYLHADEGFAETNNNDIFVHLDYDFPFTGNVNIFVLSQILAYNGNPEITAKKDMLEIKSNNTKSELMLMDLDFPYVPKPDVPMIELTEDLISKIKLASKFVGIDIYSYVYIGADFIYASDRESLFYHKFDSIINKGEPIGLNRSLIGLLNVGHKIGVHENNVVLEIADGYLIFTSDIMSNYPIDTMLEFINREKDNGNKLCNIAYFKEASKVLSPIFFGEELQISHVVNKGNKIGIYAECAVNGKSDYMFDSEIKDKFEFYIDLGKLKNIPLDYNVFINTDSMKQIVLKNDDGSIIIIVTEKM